MAFVIKFIVILTDGDLLLFVCLKFVRHVEIGRKQVKLVYGVAPTTLVPFIKDLHDVYPNIPYRDVMITCNFLKSDPLKRCMEPTWGRNKDYIGKAVRKYTKMFASWRDLKINVEFVEEDIATIVYSIDGVSFATSEFRKHPSM